MTIISQLFSLMKGLFNFQNIIAVCLSKVVEFYSTVTLFFKFHTVLAMTKKQLLFNVFIGLFKGY